MNPDCVVLEDGEEHIGSTFEVKSNTNFEKNYVIRYVNGDITVNPKELIVRIDHKVKTYGTADPAFTFHYEDNAGNVIGLIDPENSPLNVELYRTKGENVVRGDVTAADSLNKWGTTLYDGDYLISAKYDTSNKNYAVTVYDSLYGKAKQICKARGIRFEHLPNVTSIPLTEELIYTLITKKEATGNE